MPRTRWRPMSAVLLGPVMKERYLGRGLPRWTAAYPRATSAASWRVPTTVSGVTSATCVGGTLLAARPNPSSSARRRLPVSATIALAPVIPTEAVRRRSRHAPGERASPRSWGRTVTCRPARVSASASPSASPRRRGGRLRTRPEESRPGPSPPGRRPWAGFRPRRPPPACAPPPARQARAERRDADGGLGAHPGERRSGGGGRRSWVRSRGRVEEFHDVHDRDPPRGSQATQPPPSLKQTSGITGHNQLRIHAEEIAGQHVRQAPAHVRVDQVVDPRAPAAGLAAGSLHELQPGDLPE